MLPTNLLPDEDVADLGIRQLKVLQKKAGLSIFYRRCSASAFHTTRYSAALVGFGNRVSRYSAAFGSSSSTFTD